MSRRSTTGSLLAALATAALLLTGCTPAAPPPEPTSTPTGEEVAADLQPFYEQVLQWEDCDNGMQCATATAPLDWDDPSAGEAELALIRHPASGDRIGSLLVNPGGPGGSGYDFIADSLDYAVGAPLRERFDVVGFDPRGVGRSSAVACYDAAEMDEYLYGLSSSPRGSDAWMQEAREAQAAFGAACESRTGELLANVDTTSAARDLDLLRAVLGDEKLNYLGFSYGTLLGAVFAELYPEHVGRLVLDGALDPASSESDVTAAQAVGFEQALRAYLEDCLTGDDCPFSGGVDDAMSEISALLASVDQSPIRGSDGRWVGADTLITAIIYPLYSPASWSYLTDLFTSVQFGEADLALQLADGYNGRSADGTYLDNSTEAFTAINCLDYEYQGDVTVMRDKQAAVAAAAPVIGPYLGYGDLSCIDWPVPSEAVRAPVHAAGADPILVIGTTGDPATPYEWAVSLADQLDSGVLVTYNGEGHTAYNKSNQCIADTVERYLIDGVVPDADPRC